MVAVFAGFALADLPPLKQLGVGLGLAVFLDATVVRGVLVPAAMAVMGCDRRTRGYRLRRKYFALGSGSRGAMANSFALNPLRWTKSAAQLGSIFVMDCTAARRSSPGCVQELPGRNG